MKGYNRGARRAVMAALQEQGIEVHLRARVVAVQAARLRCADGVEAPFNTLFWCTGAAAAPWIAESGLATDEQGFLQVRDTLQAKDDESVFGAGDIATQVNHPRPKAGVYAVRMGPLLAHNLRAQLLEPTPAGLPTPAPVSFFAVTRRQACNSESRAVQCDRGLGMALERQYRPQLYGSFRAIARGDGSNTL